MDRKQKVKIAVFFCKNDGIHFKTIEIKMFFFVSTDPFFIFIYFCVYLFEFYILPCLLLYLIERDGVYLCVNVLWFLIFLLYGKILKTGKL